MVSTNLVLASPEDVETEAAFPGEIAHKSDDVREGHRLCLEASAGVR